MTLRFLPSFKILVPALLIVFAGVLSISYLYYTLPKSDAAIEQRYSKDLFRNMSRLQGTIEYLLRKKDPEGMRREIAVVASDPENRLIIVTNENSQIIAATRREWLDREILGIVPEFDAKIARLTKSQRRAHIRMSSDKHVLSGYTTINLGARKTELRPSRIGLLFFQKDLARAKNQAEAQILNQSLYWVGLVSVLALMLGVVFHCLLTRRAGKLVQAADALASGDLQVRTQLSGADELARLSQSFDAMAEQIAINQTRLIQDIAERKRIEAERLALETQLRQAQKMEAIGQLTGGIAHDFNNILTGVLGNATLGLEVSSELHHAKLSKYLSNIVRSGERARDLIQQMLTFSSGRRGEPRILSLAPLVNDAVKLIQPSVPSSMEIEVEIQQNVNTIRLDPVQVEQVLMNLCINARDAMNGKGQVKIALQNNDNITAVCNACRREFSGDYVELAVKDSGLGIAQETIERMFEPFYTTKEVGKGTGMGLAMVHGIVHEHGGHVMVESVAGEGARFRVLFPAVVADPDEHNVDSPDGIAPSIIQQLDGSVLLIDDEAQIAEFMCDLLQSRGLRVTMTTSSETAHKTFLQNPGAFDLVITDQTMPKMTGTDLAKDFLRIRPAVPIILYTGHSEDLSEEYVYQLGIRGYLKKPVDINGLMAMVQDLLDESNQHINL